MENDDFVMVPRHLLRTLEPVGYFRYLYQAVQASGLSHRQAWEAIEGERAAFGLPGAYDSYESCKSAKHHHRGKLFRLLDEI